MIGDSPVTVDEDGDVTVSGVTYEGTDGLWELLTKNKVEQLPIMQVHMNAYKRILE
jgi:hypothetical protein